MLREGDILRLPNTQDGQDEVVTEVVDRVIEARGGAQCHLSGGHGGLWVPASILQWAIAQAEVSIDPRSLPGAGN